MFTVLGGRKKMIFEKRGAGGGQKVNIDRLQMTKCVRYFQFKCLIRRYCIQTLLIILNIMSLLSANTKVFTKWHPPPCTRISSLILDFLPGLRSTQASINLYCNRSMFTT